MNLDELMDPGLLADMEAGGYVRRSLHDRLPLTILNYTARAQYERVWNAATLNCRGLIVDPHGVIVARPFPKFFNLAEHNLGDPRLSGPFTVAEKLDGSLGIVWEWDGHVGVATRGSFHSPQAEWATRWWHRRVGPSKVDAGTPLVEIVYPGNRVVVDYGHRSELVWLATLRADGRTVGTGLPLEHPRVFDVACLDDVHDLGCHLDGGEGFVMHFVESNTRVKVKLPEYVAMHRLLTGTSERTVWEQLSAGQDLLTAAEGMPDEFYGWLRSTVAGLRARHAGVVEDAERRFAALARWHGDRAAFAARAKQAPHPHLLFALFDGKPVAEAAWKVVRPAGSGTDQERDGEMRWR